MRRRCLKSVTDLRWRLTASFWLQQLRLLLAGFISRDHFLYAHSTHTHHGDFLYFYNHITQTCQLAGLHGDLKCGLLASISLDSTDIPNKWLVSEDVPGELRQSQAAGLVPYQYKNMCCSSRSRATTGQFHVFCLESHQKMTERQKISPIRPVISGNRAFTNQVTCAETESFTVLKGISHMELLYKIQRKQPVTFGRKRVLRLKGDG